MVCPFKGRLHSEHVPKPVCQGVFVFPGQAGATVAAYPSLLQHEAVRKVHDVLPVSQLYNLKKPVL
jgi:hypothetical protein